MQQPDAQTGLEALQALLSTRSFLGPLRVMAKRVGRFFQIPLPAFDPYIVFGPEHARKVLIGEKEKFLWRNNDPVRDVLRQGVLVTDGAEHDHYRSLMETALQPGALPQYHQMVQEQTDRVCGQWQTGQQIDMLIEGRKIALLIVMNALFGVDVWDDIPALWTPILKTIEYISPGPWIFWRKFPRPGYKKYFKVIDQYLYNIITERRKGPPRHDLLQHLVDANLSDGVIRDQMLTMLIAGHDTSTALFAWVFAMLGQHPEIHAELVSQLRSTPESETPKYLEDVIKETLRMYPPIHIGNRITAEQVDFGEGQTIPAGHRMFYSIFLTQRDPQVWENAEQFTPERFGPGKRNPAMAFIPFGGGSRSCIGSAFGLMEARLTIGRILRQYDLEPLNASKIHIHMGATLEPRPGVLMRVVANRKSDK